MFSGVGIFDLAAKIGIKSSEPIYIYARAFPGIKIWPDATDIIPTTSLTSISALVGRLVSHFQSLEKGRESTIPEVFSYLKLHGLSDPNDHAIYYLKTSKAYQCCGEIVRDWLTLFDELHYDVEICYHNTADHLPQTRARIFFVCTLRAP